MQDGFNTLANGNILSYLFLVTASFILKTFLGLAQLSKIFLFFLSFTLGSLLILPDGVVVGF